MTDFKSITQSFIRSYIIYNTIEWQRCSSFIILIHFFSSTIKYIRLTYMLQHFTIPWLNIQLPDVINSTALQTYIFGTIFGTPYIFFFLSGIVWGVKLYLYSNFDVIENYISAVIFHAGFLSYLSDYKTNMNQIGLSQMDMK